jgi:hypothetical protein
MSQQAHAREENAETFAGLQNLFRSVEEEFEKLQSKVSEQRKGFEKAAQTRVSKVQREIEKTPLFKRFDGLRKDANKGVEQGVDRILNSLNIATASDIKKLDRRLKQISKKLKELDENPEEAAPSA